MKRILLITFLLFSLLLNACNNNGVDGPDNKGPAFKDGVVNQMSTQMFNKLIWDYKANPKEFTFSGDIPVIIDFYADWCRPCKMVSPIMEDLAKEYKGKVVFYRINIDDERELAQMFNIQSIPSLLYVPANGKPQMSMGLSSKEDYIQKINSLLLTQTNK